jgi:two-component system OmpR family sensor kinase
MRLSTRLAIAVAVVLLGTLAVLSVVLVQSTRATLIEQVDRELKTTAAKTRESPWSEGEGPGGRDRYGDRAPGKRSVGTYWCDQDGNVISSDPAGYEDNPYPDPDNRELASLLSDDLDGEITTVPAEDGSIDYRVLVDRAPNGQYLVSASPLAAVDDAVGRLIGIFAGLGAVALLVAVLGSWLLIRRGLQPVDRMVGTTAAIAAGDLSLRVDEPDPRTELGRLGGAINVMLGQIEQAYQARTASEERLRRFVADAAHELRTPLTSLRGYAELYRQGALAGPEGVDSAMRRIESEGARMARLVDDLLLLARLDQQRGIERRPVELVSLLREAIQDLHAIDPSRPVTETFPAEATVVGDRVRLRQVADNLLSNARTHTPAGTPIHVAVTPSPPPSRVSVADEGPGSRGRPGQDLRALLPRRPRPAPGARAGPARLSIVASLVEAHGGSSRWTAGRARDDLHHHSARGAGPCAPRTVRVPPSIAEPSRRCGRRSTAPRAASLRARLTASSSMGSLPARRLRPVGSLCSPHLSGRAAALTPPGMSLALGSRRGVGSSQSFTCRVRSSSAGTTCHGDSGSPSPSPPARRPPLAGPAAPPDPVVPRSSRPSPRSPPLPRRRSCSSNRRGAGLHEDRPPRRGAARRPRCPRTAPRRAVRAVVVTIGLMTCS